MFTRDECPPFFRPREAAFISEGGKLCLSVEQVSSAVPNRYFVTVVIYFDSLTSLNFVLANYCGVHFQDNVSSIFKITYSSFRCNFLTTCFYSSWPLYLSVLTISVARVALASSLPY